MRAITSSSELDKHIAKPVALVKFTASWCGPCKAIAPSVERLVTKYPQVAAVEVDIDQGQSLAARYSVSAVPTFLFFEKGRLVETVRGADLNGVTRNIEALAAKGKTGGSAFSDGSFGQGRTLNSKTTAAPKPAQRSAAGVPSARLDLKKLQSQGFLSAIFAFIAAYFITLFSLDPREAGRAAGLDLKTF